MEETLERGAVIDSVACRVQPEQSYALYLPTYYSPQKRWPVLYCFDPAARGALAVKLYTEAAEKYGWIIVGSNNSRNGPMKVSFDAARAMWDDTHARLQIDDRRVYMSGFSGGARAATALAYLCDDGCVSGVIAHGAGFHPDVLPRLNSAGAKIPFAFFGLAGADDFNFPEMRGLNEVLDRLGAANRLEVFEGSHQWAPQAACTEAVAWMELQAVRSGRKRMDESLVESLWREAVARARRAESSGNPYEAWRAYAALAADFRGLRDVTEFEQKAARLRESEETKRAIRREADQFKRQRETTSELTTRLEQRMGGDERDAALASFRREVARLRKAADEQLDSDDRRVARRTLHAVFAFYFEGAQVATRETRNYSLAASRLEMAAEVETESPVLLYQLADAYAHAGEKKKALSALRRAVGKGFKSVDWVEGNHAFDSLRTDAEYREIIELMKQTH